MIVSAAFGLCVLLLAVASFQGHLTERFCGSMMAAMWMICMAAYLFIGPDAAIAVGPALDLLVGVTCILMWSQWPSNWLLLLAVSFVAQTTGHTAYDRGPHTDHRRYILQVGLNVVAWMQIALVAGGPRVHVAIGILRRMFPAPVSHYWHRGGAERKEPKCRS